MWRVGELRIRGLRHRRLRAANRRLAGIQFTGTDLALDALQALYDRKVGPRSRLIHHSDRGVQYLSIRYTERLSDVGITPSVGSAGDYLLNALADGHRVVQDGGDPSNGPWKNVEEVWAIGSAPARTHRRQTTRGERERYIGNWESQPGRLDSN